MGDRVTYIYSPAKNRRSGTSMQKMPLRGTMSRSERARRVLNGYPVCERFETREQIESYFSTDEIPCLLCGKVYKNLGIHLKRIHQIDAADYRFRYNIPTYFGLVGRATSAVMRANSSDEKKVAFIRNLGLRTKRKAPVPRRICDLVQAESKSRLRAFGAEFSRLAKRNGNPNVKFRDWSWHLEQARNHFYYKHIVPPSGMGSWSQFKKRRLKDEALGNAFELARSSCIENRPEIGWKKPRERQGVGKSQSDS